LVTMTGIWLASAVVTPGIRLGQTAFVIDQGGMDIISYVTARFELSADGYRDPAFNSRFGFSEPVKYEAEVYSEGGVTCWWIPFWILAPAALGMLALLGYLCPVKPEIGHCLCGYNLTGNVSGVCPEC